MPLTDPILSLVQMTGALLLTLTLITLTVRLGASTGVPVSTPFNLTSDKSTPQVPPSSVRVHLMCLLLLLTDLLLPLLQMTGALLLTLTFITLTC